VNIRARLVPFLVLVLLTVFALPFKGVAQADVVSGSELATNPLILKNSVTGAQVQIMPTTQWVASHTSSSNLTGTSSSSTTTSAPAGGLPAPTCTLATDNSPGDAHVLVNTTETQYDSLDLNAFGLSSDATNITGQIATESLSDGTPVNGTPAPATPQVAGGADLWYVVWNYGNAPGVKGYFLEAQYPGVPGDPGYTNDASTSNLPVDFQWGTIITSPTGGDQYTNDGAATGSFDTTGNRITITAPLSNLGAPASGAVLSSPQALGDALVGTPATGGLLETADTLTSSSADYHVGNSGTSCPGPAASAGTASLPKAGSSSNLAYFGGPIVHTVHNHVIWWLPKAGTTTYSDGSACTIPGTLSYSYEQPASGTAMVGALPGGPGGDKDYQSIITQYFNDITGTSFYNLLGQYSDLENGAPSNSADFAGQWTDNCGYTSTPSTTTGPVPGGTDAAPIYQTDIQAEVQRAIKVNNWPTGLNNEYFVYTGYGAADCFAPPGQAALTPTCSVAGPNPGYCAYHGDFMDGSGNYVLYADMADGAFAANPSALNLCYTAPIGVSDPSHTVSGTAVTDPIADAEVSITSHEQFETVNDAEVGTAQQYAPPLAWYDIINGEIGDKCAYKYGNYATDGSNIVLHGDHYIVQTEYSNWDNGCALTAYQGNGGYGGASPSVAIQKGWNLISVPVAGITDTSQLVASMTAAGELPAGSITEIQTYHNGKYATYFPGKGKALPLARTDGVLVQSSAAGTWTPAGAVYTSAPTIQLNAGWNLIAATYPNPGLTTDVIFNQIAAESGACSAAILTNQACSPTITEIKTIGAGGQTIDWKPAQADSSGNATWPQTIGNQVPFTSGMWVYASKALTWNVQGTQCQTVDTAGLCH
jgi:hypothetical protein